MGWHIHLVLNTVKIDSEIALALYKCDAQVRFAWEQECSFPMLEGIINNGKLVFNYDHLEHMDYVWEPEVLEVLCKFKVQGDVCFTSHDGDNAGESWGYHFDGKGNQTDLIRRTGAWEETGTCHPRGKGVLTCKKCGSKKTKMVARGPRRTNTMICVKCNSAKVEYVYPFPGGEVIKVEEPKPKKSKRSKELKGVATTVACEGFDYAFRSYSSFDEVKDPKFQQLRQAYVDAANALETYIGPIPEM